MTTTRTRRQRALAATVAAATAIVGLAVVRPADAATTVSTRRVFGANRYATAGQIAVDSALGTPTGAIVATGENYPDALAAATLAGANGPAPIVLTQSATYTSDAKSALATLKGKGVSAVTVVGGPAAVSENVKNQIASDGFSVTRIGGTDRYATAAQIATAAAARQTGGVGLVGGKKTALFATGENFPDALAGGPIAERFDLPLLLVTASAVPQATQDAIKSLGIANAIVLGGTNAVSAAVATTIGTLTGDSSVDRLFGSNRNGTAAAIGDYAASSLSFPTTTAMLATGLNFPDALAAGVLAGVLGAPIVLTASLPSESAAFLDRHSDTITAIIATGGTSVISDADVTSAKTSAQNTSNDVNQTSGPELLRVETAGTDSGTGGPILRYVFDEPVSVLVSASFRSWTAYGERTDSTAAAVDSTNSSAINAAFPAASTTQVGEATVYTVVAGAVQDASSVSNAEGSANASTTRSFEGTDLRAPDLLTVAAVSGASNAETYDFTFDVALTGATTGNFQIVDTDGAVRTATTATVQTSSTSVVRAEFSAPASGKSGSRGVALANAVTADTTKGGLSGNLLESRTIAGRTASTDFPDLVSVTLNTSGGTTAVFTFDEAIETLSGSGGSFGSAAAFHLVYRTGAAIAGTSVDRSSSNAATVTFSGSGSVNELVGSAYVDSGAATSSGGTLSTKPARAAQIGVSTSFAPGIYLGPKLSSVTKSTVTSSGTTTGYKIVYVFDQNVSSTLTQSGNAGFFAVSATGTRVAITASYCTRGTDLAATTVTCDSSGSTDTTSTAATAMRDAKLATVGAATVTGTKVRTVGGSTWTASTLNHEEVGIV